jgi:hypothetical protein
MMNHINKSLVMLSIVGLFFSSAVMAKIELTKDQVKQQVVQACELEAKNRYGEKAIKNIGKKSKWMKGLKGASIKLKVKPEAKRLTKYSCVLAVDSSVTFYKA